MTPETDRDLLRQFVEQQSDTAFAGLVKRHINLVHSVALRQTDDNHHAEEITQAVFIIFAKKAATLRHEKALTSWLFQTTRLTVNNFLRGELRRREREQEAYMQSTLNDPAEDVWPRIAPLLDAAVEKLGETDRRAILLRFYEGRNLRDVGTALGTSEDTATKRVNRALEKLRKFFSKRGVALTGTAIAGAVSATSVQAAPVGLAKTISVVAIAEGSITSASTISLVKGTLKIMTYAKLKLAVGITTGILLAAGAATMAILQTNAGDKLTTAEIFKQSQDAYASLSSYSDEGKTVVVMGSTTMTTTFNVKLARPSLYRIEWSQPTDYFTNSGIVWSTGNGDFMVMRMGAGAVTKQRDRDSALAIASAVSGGAAATVPWRFFKIKRDNQLAYAADVKQLADETVDGTGCYVFTRELNGTTRTIWFGKKDYLIRQSRNVMTPEAMKSGNEKFSKFTGAIPKTAPQGTTLTETHFNIKVNRQFSPADFQR